jgi:hypothetical protein
MNRDRLIVLAAYIITVLLLMVVVGIETGRAATTTSHHNSLGVVPYETNPLIYVAGSVADASRVDDAVNIRFQPLGTYSLFDQNILLCGTDKLVAKFDGKHNPMVLTYERQAHRAVNGVGCHDLIRVDNLEPSRGNFNDKN